MNLFRRILIALAGGTVVLLGIALIPLPGPGLLVILAGLGILATEFAWARRLLIKARSYLPGKKSPPPEPPGEGKISRPADSADGRKLATKSHSDGD